MYSETQNENGTYNTRCLYCFMTVATAVETKEELEHVEAQHVCPERALSELLAAKADDARQLSVDVIFQKLELACANLCSLPRHG